MQGIKRNHDTVSFQCPTTPALEEIAHHALSNFGHLIGRTESISWAEFAARIKATYRHASCHHVADQVCRL